MTAYRVNYATLYAVVEADTPEAATGIAKAWRERKRVWSGRPPPEVLDDEYTARPATERDVGWAASFGIRPYRDMPPPRRRKVRHSAVEGVGVVRGREAA